MLVGLVVEGVAEHDGGRDVEHGRRAVEHGVALPPGLANDPCTADLTTTVQPLGGGAPHVVHTTPAANPKIDCFYVYPTVSSEPTTNANLQVGPEEIGVAQQQASQFSQVCHVFAPIYPQLTLSAITKPGAIGQGGAIAYRGVLDAWNDYLAHDNGGRGVVLIGHSQGSGMLIQLIRNEIDPNPAERKLLVSAILLGGNVTVPVGQDVGGDFQHVPACRTERQTGCVVAYSSFDQTPPADAIFGRAGVGIVSGNRPASATPLQVLCTNPAALAGGPAPLQSMFRTSGMPGTLGAAAASMFGGHTPTASTPWVEGDGWYTGQCEDAAGADVLMVTPVGTAPPLTPSPSPAWGLHLADVNIALGSLVDMVRDQAGAWR